MMLRRLTALGRVLELARAIPTAFVRRKPRSQAMSDWLRNHRADKPKFTGYRRHTGGILSDIKQFDAERHLDNWLPARRVQPWTA
jgi:hypothetical protein